MGGGLGGAGDCGGSGSVGCVSGRVGRKIGVALHASRPSKLGPQMQTPAWQLLEPSHGKPMQVSGQNCAREVGQVMEPTIPDGAGGVITSLGV